MIKIWYLLKCPEGYEQNCARQYRDFAGPQKLQEVVCFEYQRMMRYGGSWHLERRALFPGYVFLSGDRLPLKDRMPLVPCEPPYLKELCQEDNLVVMSRGIIRNGNTVVTSGPLKGREGLIRRINRHRRTAEIEIPFRGKTAQVTVGLEIYEKSEG